jgi:hypothetical protein
MDFAVVTATCGVPPPGGPSGPEGPSGPVSPLPPVQPPASSKAASAPAQTRLCDEAIQFLPVVVIVRLRPAAIHQSGSCAG